MLQEMSRLYINSSGELCLKILNQGGVYIFIVIGASDERGGGFSYRLKDEKCK